MHFSLRKSSGWVMPMNLKRNVMVERGKFKASERRARRVKALGARLALVAVVLSFEASITPTLPLSRIVQCTLYSCLASVTSTRVSQISRSTQPMMQRFNIGLSNTIATLSFQFIQPSHCSILHRRSAAVPAGSASRSLIESFADIAANG
jgi:hypothetical protein